MKIGFFDDYRLGVILGDSIVDVSAAVAEVPRLGPHDLINGLIAGYQTHRSRLEDAAIRGKRSSIDPLLHILLTVGCQDAFATFVVPATWS